MGRFVSRIQNNDSERLKRILDDKKRTIGIDVKSLDKQVEEKLEIKLKKEENEKYYNKLQAQYCQQLSKLQLDEELKRRTSAKEINEFNKNKIKEKSNVTENEIKDYGPSSMQVFNGEDIEMKKRILLQRQNNQENWKKDIEERRNEIKLQKLNDLKQYNLIKQQKEILDKYYLEEKHKEIKDRVEIANENKCLSEEKKKKEKLKIIKNNDLNQLEIEKQLKMPLLTEDPRQSQSYLEKTKVRSDHWKGMNGHELKEIKEIQENQKIEMKEMKEKEKLNNKNHDKNLILINNEIMKNDILKEMKKKEETKEYALYLKNQIEQKKENDDKINNEYQNKIEDSFYLQFNTSHR